MPPVPGGSTARNTVDDQTVETPYTLHGVRAMRGILRHSVSGISDVDHHGTIVGHPACIATTGATRDEGQEEQCCEFSGGPVGARQSITERQPGNSVEKGTERLRPSTECHSERRQRCDVAMVARDPETKLNNRTSSVMGHTATETFSTLRQFWLKHFDAMEVLIMDQGTEFGADFQHLCQSRGYCPW